MQSQACVLPRASASRLSQPYGIDCLHSRRTNWQPAHPVPRTPQMPKLSFVGSYSSNRGCARQLSLATLSLVMLSCCLHELSFAPEPHVRVCCWQSGSLLVSVQKPLFEGSICFFVMRFSPSIPSRFNFWQTSKWHQIRIAMIYATLASLHRSYGANVRSW